MNRFRCDISGNAPLPPSEADLTKIGARFREIRAAKLFTRTLLAQGIGPQDVLAKAREICRLRYEPLPADERESLSEVVMTAVIDVVADWIIERDRAEARLNAWIDQTVAQNRAFVHIRPSRTTPRAHVEGNRQGPTESSPEAEIARGQPLP